MAEMNVPVFVYGSLQSRRVLQVLLRRTPQLHAAEISGYRRLKVKVWIMSTPNALPHPSLYFRGCSAASTSSLAFTLSSIPCHPNCIPPPAHSHPLIIPSPSSTSSRAKVFQPLFRPLLKRQFPAAFSLFLIQSWPSLINLRVSFARIDDIFD